MRTYTLISVFVVVAHLAFAQTCDMYVGGYLPAYRDPATVDYSKLSHVFYAFGRTTVYGDLVIANEFTTFLSFKNASVGKQRFLSLAGAAEFSCMTDSPQARATFVNHCVAFCKQHAFQGIDMDWEGITTASDSAKYGALMRELAIALHNKDLKLVATVSYGKYGGTFYNTGALKKADWIQLMVYDEAGTWAASPFANHSTYQHMIYAITYWRERGYTDLSKIVIGLPFYGYTFKSTLGGRGIAMRYNQVIENYPLLSCADDGVGLTLFNGPETIRRKVEYVKNNGLKGVMVWDLGQDINAADDKSLLKAISQGACGLPAACAALVSVTMEDFSPNILFKNPVNGVLRLTLQQPAAGTSSLEIVNVTGKVVFAKKESFAQATEDVDMAAHAPGVYVMRVVLPENKTVVRRFMKL